MMRPLPMITVLSVSAATLPSTVFAHPGHDHAHWTSAGLHSIAALALIAAAAAGVWFLARRRRGQLRSQAVEKHSKR